MKQLTSIAALWTFFLPFLSACEQPVVKNDVLKKVSPYTVDETMNRFEAIVKKKGFGVFARVDHKKNAQGAGLEMNASQVLIFGNPKGGTLLMQQDAGVALDLPLRVAVYKDADNKVYIAYHDPQAMAGYYQLTDNKVIPKVTVGLSKLTSAAIASKE